MTAVSRQSASRQRAATVRVLAELGACVKTAKYNGATPVCIAAQEGHAEVVRVLAELGVCVKTPTDNGTTPILSAAHGGHVKVIRLLAHLKADVTTYNAPLRMCVEGGHFEATKALLLLGAPITTRDLKQRIGASSVCTPQLRADLQAWAADALVQHRIFLSTFLFGTSAHRDEIALSILEGVEEVRKKVAAFVGIMVGKELRRTRAMGPAIAAINWAAHDEQRCERCGETTPDGAIFDRPECQERACFRCSTGNFSP